MSDAMVTGRMPSAKKKAGNQVLEQFGLSASQAINQLYDFLIEKQELPFACDKKEPLTSEKVAQARSFIRSIPRKSRFSNMSDSEIKAARLKELIEQ